MLKKLSFATLAVLIVAPNFSGVAFARADVDPRALQDAVKEQGRGDHVVLAQREGTTVFGHSTSRDDRRIGDRDGNAAG